MCFTAFIITVIPYIYNILFGYFCSEMNQFCTDSCFLIFFQNLLDKPAGKV